jgi:23S rRNA pseudouridine1911/1915/1917 synthase
MENVLSSRVPVAGIGVPLATWLAVRFRYLDETAWRIEIAAGRVRRNGIVACAEQVLALGDEVAYRPPAAAPRATPPVLIVHDDPDFVVVDKPAHLVAHAEGAFAQNTFLAALARDCGEDVRLTLVHRLDRETSGLLLLAKNADANTRLQQQFANGTVHKHYVAVVHGRLATSHFTIDAAIGPAANSIVTARRGVREPGTPKTRAARTDVFVLEQFAQHALLRLVPHTGRTHQLRVHLEHAGHPLVGDKMYGRTDAEYLEYVRHLKADGDPAWDNRLGAGRQLLHAASLDFAHPHTGTAIRLNAPMPADLQSFVDRCPRDSDRG